MHVRPVNSKRVNYVPGIKIEKIGAPDRIGQRLRRLVVASLVGLGSNL
jgi:hypothetical protein